MKEAIVEAQRQKLQLFVLGGGTNVLFSDRGFDGLVLRPNTSSVDARGETVVVGAGVSMANLVAFAAEHGLSGLEWAGGLPGTVGGAIRGNAGAFGGEMRGAVESVRSIDIGSGEERERRASVCRFDYRTSIFKEKNGREIILSAMLRLKKGDARKIAEAVKEKVDYRERHHPLEYPSIGSIFKNVSVKAVPKAHRATFSRVVKADPFPVVPAAYLISEAGLRGISCGGAVVSPKHPNFIVNALMATAADVKNLINLVKGEVRRKFGIELEIEVVEI